MTDRDPNKVQMMTLDCGTQLGICWFDDETGKWVATKIVLPIAVEHLHVVVPRSPPGRPAHLTSETSTCKGPK